MKIIVVYDIPVEQDPIRTQLREYLKNWGGQFLQYSVYEVDLHPKHLRPLISGIKKIMKKAPEGKVEIIQPCQKCYTKIAKIGDLALTF